MEKCHYQKASGPAWIGKSQNRKMSQPAYIGRFPILHKNGF